MIYEPSFSSIVRLRAKSSRADDYDFESDVASHPKHHLLGNLRVLRESDIFLEERFASHTQTTGTGWRTEPKSNVRKTKHAFLLLLSSALSSAVFSHTRGRKRSRVGNVCTMRTHTQRAAYPEEGGMKFSSSFLCVPRMEVSE